jgi:tetratricopeptide (TPR) repeat protein
VNKRFIITALIFTCFLLCPTLSANGQATKTTAEDHFNRGKESFDRWDWDAAIISFSKAVRLNPKYAEAYLYRGLSRLGKGGDLDRAMSDLTKTIELDPGNIDAYEQRAFYYAVQEKYELAIKDYDKVVELAPNKPSSYVSRAGFYRSRENYDLAVRDYTTAIKLVPNNDFTYSLRGNVYTQKGDYDSAIWDFTKAIALCRDDFILGYYADRARAYSKKGDYALGIEDISRVIRLRDSASDYEERAGIYRRMGQVSLAEADERKARELRKNGKY